MLQQGKIRRLCLLMMTKKTVDLLRRYLEKNGFENVASLRPEELISRPRVDFDLLILDIMMPKVDGLEVCKRVRR